LQKLTAGKFHDASLKRNLRWWLGNSLGINDIGAKGTTHYSYSDSYSPAAAKRTFGRASLGTPDAND
jgi:hypothetical protein